ncbi:Uncharacterized protein dnl_32740 [Desulfonema limicola]|uniref:Uncharacterized protein n=1 Tax=Desulfonema limicola TaxID=45656 RepID=A0A975B955_9BACT|nr:hypothetical protein [Desulfonema limicola]QTA80957.1 Uncharacterized protein dnl_32740 [Desulfonema limicola]
MDEKFLELWGNLLLSAARGKKQTNDIFRWMQSGFPNLNETSDKPGFPDFKDLSEMFHRLYGLDQLSNRSEEYKKMSNKALKDFQQSFKDYLCSMGIVSKNEHLALVEKYEKLKAKCADQEETIKHLKMLLDSKGTNSAETSYQFQDIIKNQGDLFQKMMNDLGHHFNKTGLDKTGLDKTEVNPEKESSEKEE